MKQNLLYLQLLISLEIFNSLWDIQHSDEMLDLDSKVQVTTGGDKTKVVVSTQHQG